jgi:hypothetical protein
VRFTTPVYNLLFLLLTLWSGGVEQGYHVP